MASTPKACPRDSQRQGDHRRVSTLQRRFAPQAQTADRSPCPRSRKSGSRGSPFPPGRGPPEYPTTSAGSSPGIRCRVRRAPWAGQFSLHPVPRMRSRHPVPAEAHNNVADLMQQFVLASCLRQRLIARAQRMQRAVQPPQFFINGALACRIRRNWRGEAAGSRK